MSNAMKVSIGIGIVRVRGAGIMHRSSTSRKLGFFSKGFFLKEKFVLRRNRKKPKSFYTDIIKK